METRNQAEFVYGGFGFPVVLKDVKMLKIRGEWTPDVNFNELADETMHNLADKKRLTGAEVRFVRQYLDMNIKRFAEYFGVSVDDVSKWEKDGADIRG